MPMLSGMPRSVLILLPLLLLGAQAQPAAPQCRAEYARPDFVKLRAEYRTSIARWKANPPRNYSFEYHQFAAPLRFPDTTVTVRGGVNVTVQPHEAGQPSPSARYTMARRFLSVWAAVVQAEQQPCPELQINYDPQYGFPNRLYVGQAVQNMADGNGEWSITDFKVLGAGK